MIEFIKSLLVNQNLEEDFRPIINGIVGKKAIYDPIKEINSEIKVAFIDGGNSTILITPSFIISKIRLGTSIFGSKKIKESNIDYDMIAYNNNGWKVKLNEEIIELSSNSVSENGRVNLERIPGLIRRMLELKLANNVEADYVVLDGTLDNTFEEEKPLLAALNSNVVAFNKTNSIRTTKGNSYSALLGRNKEKFVCKNIVDNIHFVKFAKNEYVFRIDGNISDDLISFLHKNSQDPVFRGYPYGLVVADRAARISNYETKTAKIELLSKLGKDNQAIKELTAGTTAHEILDSQNIY